MLSCVGDHILQEFNTLFLTRFTTYKIALPFQTKTWEGRGPQTDKHLPQSPFTHKFFLIMTFGIAFYQSNLSTTEMYTGTRTHLSSSLVASVFHGRTGQPKIPLS